MKFLPGSILCICLLQTFFLKAAEDGDSITFGHHDLTHFSGEISYNIESIRKGVEMLRNKETDEGIRLISSGTDNLNTVTHGFRNLTYQPAELLQLIHDLAANRVSENERELGNLFVTNIFITPQVSLSKTISKYARKYPSSVFIARIDLLYSSFYLTGGELEEKIHSLLAMKPSLVAANMATGEFYYNQQNFTEALVYFDKVTAFSPEYAIAYNFKGECNKELERYDSALVCFERASVLAVNPMAYINRGNTWLAMEKYDSAICDFRKVLRLIPNYDWAFNNIGVAYENLEQYDSALVYLNRAIEIDNTNAVFYDNRGDVYYDQDKYEKAKLDYNRAIDRNPENKSYYGDKGNACYYNDEIEEAIFAFQKSVEVDSTYSFGWKRLADCYYDQDNFQKALTYSRKAVHFDPGYSRAWYRLGAIYEELGQLTSQIASYRKAAEIDSTYDGALGNLGWAYYQANNFDSCIYFSIKAIHHNEYAYYAKFNIALSRLRQGLVFDAQQLYYKYLTEYNSLHDKDDANGGPDGAIEDLQNLVKKNILVDDAQNILINIFKVETP